MSGIPALLLNLLLELTKHIAEIDMGLSAIYIYNSVMINMRNEQDVRKGL